MTYSWLLNGNASTINSNFLGTTDPMPIIFKTNGVEAMRIDPFGNIAMGINAPLSKLHIKNGSVLFEGTTGGLPITGSGTRMMWIPSMGGAFRAGVVIGNAWDAIGNSSVAFGFNTTASGLYSAAFGNSANAIAEGAVAFGNNSNAIGLYSTAIGWGVTAKAYHSIVIGQYNHISGTSTNWISSDELFVVGNGVTSDKPSNALTVLKNGNTGLGTYSPLNRLDVTGAIAVGGGYAGSKTAPLNGAIIRGNIGVGTATPINKLDVEGAVAIGNTYAGLQTAPNRV
jgi:hypothetical protein